MFFGIHFKTPLWVKKCVRMQTQEGKKVGKTWPSGPERTPFWLPESAIITFKEKKLQKYMGFTIVELLVAMAVFVIVVTVATAIFIRSLQNQRRLVTVMGMQTNLDTALEQMAREVRGGYLFSASTLTCANSVSFDTASGTAVSYGLSSSSIVRNGQPITSSDVKVSNLCFIVSQAPLGDAGMYTNPGSPCNPWRVTVAAEVEPRVAGQSNNIEPFYLQTTVSSRVLPKDMPADIKGQYGYTSCQ